MQRMQGIPLHRIAVVLPFTRFLADIGTPVERGFRQVGLPYAALEDANHYVSTCKFWAFVGHMARSEGIEDLGFRVGLDYGRELRRPAHVQPALPVAHAPPRNYNRQRTGQKDHIAQPHRTRAPAAR